jgi:hypothetical protein
MADLGLSGSGFYGASDSGEHSLSSSSELDLSSSSGIVSYGDKTASPELLERSMDSSPVGAPLPLSDKYTIEKEWGGAAMADYVNALRRDHPTMTLDAMKEIPEMKLLSEIFSANKGKSSPDSAVSVALKDPRMKKVIEWADKNFGGISAYKTTLKEITKVRLLLAVRRGVKYISDETKRAKYEVNIHAGTVQRGSNPLDTESLKRMYVKQSNNSNNNNVANDNNAPNNNNAPNDSTNKQGNYVVRDVIWVMDKDGNFYSHVSKLGRIHHSSFLAGEGIGAGGDWKIKNGEITEISGQSGHYKPTIDRFVSALTQLEGRGALNSEKEVVKVWDKDSGAEKKVSLTHLRLNQHKYQPFMP